MAYIGIIVVLVAVVGVAIWIGGTASRSRSGASDGNADHDVTSTDVKPPAHPSEPVPGSATAQDRDPQSRQTSTRQPASVAVVAAVAVRQRRGSDELAP
ncbi:MAG: hypothetical protein JWO77_666 [Ilumatobacteraceae bacterium]|nr:hypothetical protein [Ilumatobacteraceae bacterium]